MLLGLLTEKGKIFRVVDNFNRVDNAVVGSAITGQLWAVISGSWGIENNKAKLIVTSGSTDRIVIDAGISDCYIKVTFVTNMNDQRILFRYKNTTNELFVKIGPTTCAIYRRVSGTATLIGQISHACIPNDVLSVRCSGNNISFYVNEVLKIELSEEVNKTNTIHGFGGLNVSGLTFDDFSVEAI